jgi:hypothetical protein
MITIIVIVSEMTAPFNESIFVAAVADEYGIRLTNNHMFSDIYDIIDEFLTRYPNFNDYYQSHYRNPSLSQIQYHLYCKVDEYIDDGIVSDADTVSGDDD